MITKKKKRKKENPENFLGGQTNLQSDPGEVAAAYEVGGEGYFVI